MDWAVKVYDSAITLQFAFYPLTLFDASVCYFYSKSSMLEICAFCVTIVIMLQNIIFIGKTFAFEMSWIKQILISPNLSIYLFAFVISPLIFIDCFICNLCKMDGLFLGFISLPNSSGLTSELATFYSLHICYLEDK